MLALLFFLFLYAHTNAVNAQTVSTQCSPVQSWQYPAPTQTSDRCSSFGIGQLTSYDNVCVLYLHTTNLLLRCGENSAQAPIVWDQPLFLDGRTLSGLRLNADNMLQAVCTDGSVAWQPGYSAYWGADVPNRWTFVVDSKSKTLNVTRDNVVVWDSLNYAAQPHLSHRLINFYRDWVLSDTASTHRVVLSSNEFYLESAANQRIWTAPTDNGRTLGNMGFDTEGHLILKYADGSEAWRPSYPVVLEPIGKANQKWYFFVDGRSKSFNITNNDINVWDSINGPAKVYVSDSRYVLNSNDGFGTKDGACVMALSGTELWFECFSVRIWTAPVLPSSGVLKQLYFDNEGRLKLAYATPDNLVDTTKTAWAPTYATFGPATGKVWSFLLDSRSKTLNITFDGYTMWDSLNGGRTLTHKGSHLVVGQQLFVLDYLMHGYPSTYMVLLPSGNACLYMYALPGFNSSALRWCNNLGFTTKERINQWFSFVSAEGFYCTQSFGDTSLVQDWIIPLDSSVYCTSPAQRFSFGPYPPASTTYELWFDKNIITVINPSNFEQQNLIKLYQYDFSNIYTLQSNNLYSYDMFLDNQMFVGFDEGVWGRLVFTSKYAQVCLFSAVFITSSDYGAYTFIKPDTEPVACSLTNKYVKKENTLSQNPYVFFDVARGFSTAALTVQVREWPVDPLFMSAAGSIYDSFPERVTSSAGNFELFITGSGIKIRQYFADSTSVVFDVDMSIVGTYTHVLTVSTNDVSQRGLQQNKRFTDRSCKSVMLIYGDGTFCLASTGVSSCLTPFNIFRIPDDDVFYCSGTATPITDRTMQLKVQQFPSGLLRVVNVDETDNFWFSFDVRLFDSSKIPSGSSVETRWDDDALGISTYVNDVLLWSSKTNKITEYFRKPAGSVFRRIVSLKASKCSVNALHDLNTPMLFTDSCGFTQSPFPTAFIAAEDTSPPAPVNGLQISFFKPRTTTTPTERGVMFCAGMSQRVVDNFNPAIGTKVTLLCERVQWFNLNGTKSQTPDFKPCYTASTNIFNYFWVRVTIGMNNGYTQEASYWNRNFKDKMFTSLYPDFSKSACECRKGVVGQMYTFYGGTQCAASCVVNGPHAPPPTEQHVWCYISSSGVSVIYSTLPDRSVVGFAPLSEPVALQVNVNYEDTKCPTYYSSWYTGFCTILDPLSGPPVLATFVFPTGSSIDCQMTRRDFLYPERVTKLYCYTINVATTLHNGGYFYNIQIVSFNQNTLTGSVIPSLPSVYYLQCDQKYVRWIENGEYSCQYSISVLELPESTTAINYITLEDLHLCIASECTTLYYSPAPAFYPAYRLSLGLEPFTFEDGIHCNTDLIPVDINSIHLDSSIRQADPTTTYFRVCVSSLCAAGRYGFFCGGVCPDCASLHPRTVCNEGKNGTGACECIPGLVWDSDGVGCIDPLEKCPLKLNTLYGPSNIFDRCEIAPSASYYESVTIKIAASSHVQYIPYVSQSFKCLMPVQSNTHQKRTMLCSGFTAFPDQTITSSIDFGSRLTFDEQVRNLAPQPYVAFCNGRGKAIMRFNLSTQAFINSRFANTPTDSSSDTFAKTALLQSMFRTQGTLIEADNSMVFYTESPLSVTNLVCECDYGTFWGSQCENVCSGFIPGLQYCNRVTGNITCATGSNSFFNATSQQCQRLVCPAGYAGPQCVVQCPLCKSDQYCEQGVYGSGMCVCTDPSKYFQASTGTCVSLDILCGPLNSQGVRCSGRGECAASKAGNTECTCADTHTGAFCQYSLTDVLRPFSTVYDCGVLWLPPPASSPLSNGGIFPMILHDRGWIQQIDTETLTYNQASFQDEYGDTIYLPSGSAVNLTFPNGLNTNQELQLKFLCQSVIDCIGYVYLLPSRTYVFLTDDSSLASTRTLALFNAALMNNNIQDWRLLSRVRGYNCDLSQFSSFRDIYQPSVGLQHYLQQVPLYAQFISSLSLEAQRAASLDHWRTLGFLLRVNPVDQFCLLSPTYKTSESQCKLDTGFCRDYCGNTMNTFFAPNYKGFCKIMTSINDMQTPTAACDCACFGNNDVNTPQVCGTTLGSNVKKYTGINCRNDLLSDCGYTSISAPCNARGSCLLRSQPWADDSSLLTETGYCKCSLGYGGDSGFCDVATTSCDRKTIGGVDVFCNGHGTCVNNSISTVDSLQCTCDLGWGGLFCENDFRNCINPSFTNPEVAECGGLDQGQCRQNSTGGFSCLCKQDPVTLQRRFGKYCEVSACSAAATNGFCKVSDNDATVGVNQCYPAFYGERCEKTYCTQAYTKDYCLCANSDFINQRFQYNQTFPKANGNLVVCTSGCPLATINNTQVQCGSTKAVITGTCNDKQLTTTACDPSDPVIESGALSYPGTSKCTCGSGYRLSSIGTCISSCPNGFIPSVTPCTTDLTADKCLQQPTTVAPTTVAPPPTGTTTAYMTTSGPTTRTPTTSPGATTQVPTTALPTTQFGSTTNSPTSNSPTSTYISSSSTGLNSSIYANTTNTSSSSSASFFTTETIVAIVGGAAVASLVAGAVVVALKLKAVGIGSAKVAAASTTSTTSSSATSTTKSQFKISYTRFEPLHKL